MEERSPAKSTGSALASELSPVEIMPSAHRTSTVDSVRSIIDFALERTYLSALSASPAAPPLHKQASAERPLAWRRVVRLPVHPIRGADEFLALRWQRMLTALHSWERRLVVLLLRHNGKTSLYVGTLSPYGLVSRTKAIAQLHQAITSEVPGLTLESLAGSVEGEPIEIKRQLVDPMARLQSCGAITGLPSMQEHASNRHDLTIPGLLSGLGHAAQGMKGPGGRECNYAIVIIADAVADFAISETIDRLRMIGETVYSDIRSSYQQGKSESSAVRALSTNRIIGTFLAAVGGVAAMGLAAAAPAIGGVATTGLAAAAPAAIPHAVSGFAAVAGKAALHGASALLASSPTISAGTSETVSRQHLNMVAQHCKELADRHIERLNRGRSVGFWNTGIYVLGDTDDTVLTISGILRAAFSGKDSHIEPIRAILLPPSMRGHEYVQEFNHIPFPSVTDVSEWHPLGPLYQSITTPLNTEELAILTALPNRDVPGLRTDKNRVQFAWNPPIVEREQGRISLGRLIGSGGVEVGPYQFDVNTLVRHGLLVGATGSGKSTTCRRLVTEALARGKSFLIIEPAKDDYARWAVEQNRGRSSGEKIALYMPGASSFDGQQTEQLRLNPFEPAYLHATECDLLGRIERAVAILNASMPMHEVLPILLEAAVMRLCEKNFGRNIDELPADGVFPKVENLIQEAHYHLYQDAGSGRYDSNVRANLFAAMESRILSLSRGRRGQVLNVPRSTSPELLFERPAIINLSRLGSEADKALVMALLLVGICEWRMNRYAAELDYRNRARDGELAHLAVVEEAHTVLRRSDAIVSSSGNAQAVVSRMFGDMLAEVRQYGQGLLVVDQDPSQLITGVIKNSSFRIVHKLPHQEDRAALAAAMLLSPDQCDFLSVLPPGHAVISTDQDDSPCWVAING